jgi:Tfp pilus assembly protein PilF
MGRKDYQQSERIYQAIVKQQPDSALVYNNLAWVTGQLKKDGAIAYAEKAVSLSPNQPAFMDTLAGLLAEKGDFDKALEIQKKVVELNKSAPEFQLNLAKIQIKAGRKVEAKAVLTELAKLGDKFAGQSEVTSLLKD